MGDLLSIIIHMDVNNGCRISHQGPIPKGYCTGMDGGITSGMELVITSLAMEDRPISSRFL